MNKLTRYIDLTQTLTPGMPDWNGSCDFQLNTVLTHEENGLCAQNIMTMTGIGTHMDAPFHFDLEGFDIAQLPVEDLIAPAIVIDVQHKITPDYFIAVEDIKAHEQQFGKIPTNCLILAHTGWAQHWHDPQKYRNPDLEGNMHFPGFSVEAIEYLMTCDILGVGIDTLSPDGSNMAFPAHHILLGNNKYIIENLCNLDSLPSTGATVTALPIKIAKGAEAPCRVIAEINK